MKKILLMMILILWCLLPCFLDAQDEPQFAVSDWKKLDNTSKEREVLIYFKAYWTGSRDATQMFLEEKEGDAARHFLAILILNSDITQSDFVKKIDSLVEGAKDSEDVLSYFEKANIFFMTKAPKKTNNPCRGPGSKK